MTGASASLRSRSDESARLWRRSLAPAHWRHGNTRKVLDSAPFHPRGHTEGRVHDDPAADEPPRDPIRPDDGAAPGPDAPPRGRAIADRVSDPGSARSCGWSTAGKGSAAPIEAPDPANRCAALREPVPQSLRQQELVCLSSGHVNCPRYLRGALEVEPVRPVRTPRAAPSVTSPRRRPVPWRSSWLAFLLSLGFVLANGGVVLTAVARDPGPVGRRSSARSRPHHRRPPRRRSRRAEPTPAPTATPAPTPADSPSPTPTAGAERQPRRPSRPRRPRRPHRRPSRPPAAMRC